MNFFKPEKTVMFDFPYFLGMFLTFGIGILGCFFIKKKTKNFQKWFIFGLFALNTVLHFLKMFDSYYQQRLPESYASMTFDNICAVSAILFSVTYLCKSKVLKDYMFFMGIISGIAAIAYPSGGVLNRAPYAFDYFRFYICHGIILFGPIYMVLCGLHKLNYRRLYKTPFVFWGVLTIIFMNTIICGELGLTDIRSTNFLNPGYERNASLVFGPTKEFEKASALLLIFVPKFLKVVPFGPYKGQFKCTPLLWLLIPSYIYILLVSIIMILPFEHKHMKEDFINLKIKIKKLLNKTNKTKEDKKDVESNEVELNSDKKIE